MTNSDRDPDAIDRIRDDAIMAEAADKLQEQAARIRELEAQVSELTEQRNAVIEAVLGEEWELAHMDSASLFHEIEEQIEQYRKTAKHYEETAVYNGKQWRAATERERVYLEYLHKFADLDNWQTAERFASDETSLEYTWIGYDEPIDLASAALAAAQEGTSNE